MKNLPLLAFCFFIAYSCKNQVSDPAKDVKLNIENSMPGSFAHTVYFWLKEPDNAQVCKAFEPSLSKFLESSADITTYHLGKPADTYRPIIDTSYTYALLTTFKDKAGHDRYQEDPAHKLFVKESESLWNRVLIYDSVDVLK